jgi:peptide/nickel transport system permease protein
VSDPAVTASVTAHAVRWGARPTALARRTLAIRRSRIGLGILVVLVLIALLGPFVAPESPTAFVGRPYQGPSEAAVFGTDYLGRDVLSRFLYGGRSVLGLSVAATALGVGAGVLLGLVSAYSRAWLDEALMRLLDVFMAFPPVIFALLIVATTGPKLWLLVLTVAAVHAPRVARLVRGAALEVVERDFVRAAEAIGVPRRRILAGEILPNIVSPLLVETSLRLTFSIALVASLSFLGFGLQPPAADWGLMISENKNGLSVQPWPVVLPVAAIGLLTIATNLIADGLSRALIGIDRRPTVEP